MRTLFVVSGGDAPGINALLGRYTAQAELNGDVILGAVGGFPGLLEKNIVHLDSQQLVPWVGRAGSFLPSSRDPVLSNADSRSHMEVVLKGLNIDNLVLFGGNGTLRHIPPLLQSWGIPYIGIPTTIDNDVPGTEMTLGFDSACNYAYQSIDGAMETAHALRGRIFMVETLGGTCGNLALAVANGSDAHVVILPEYEYDDQWLADRLKGCVQRYGYALLVICEGARGARTLADDIPKWIEIRVRDVRLGHAQRGAKPSHQDRVLAGEMARLAFTALRSKTQSGVVVVQNGQVELHEGLLTEQRLPPPDADLYQAINGGDIGFSGD